ncbi:MAG: MMPL family transporter [Actinomycetota bacterium]
MSHALFEWGRFAARRPWMVIGVWLVAAVAIIGASNTIGRELEDSFGAPGLDSQEALDLLASAQADEAGLTAQVVVTPADGSATFFDSPEAVAALDEVHEAVVALPNVLDAGDPAAALDAGPEAAVASGSVSADGRIAIVRIQYPVMEELRAADLERLVETVEAEREGSPLQIEMNGDLFTAFGEPETGVGEMIGLMAAVVILLVAFGSVIAMGLPIGMALFGLAVGISLMPLISWVIQIPAWTPQLATMVGLGVGIDYALFIVTRHRETLSEGVGVVDSIGHAIATAGQAVIFAGGTVVIAILGLAVAGVPFMTAAGVATSAIVAVMVLASITVLPAFLGLSGTWINRLRVPFGAGRDAVRPASSASVGRGWRRWGEHVAAHPWVYSVGVTALLLALTAPVLALRLGAPDQGTLPESRTERRAYDLVAEGFGPGINGPLVIAVDTSEDPTVLEPLMAAVSADPGVVAVAPPQVDPATGVAAVIAFPTTAPQDDATYETIQRLRADVLPTVLDDSPARAHVGGQTASLADVGGQVVERMPYFIAAVLALSFVLLMILFRSVLVPAKAALLNLLSIGASYGVLVMVFQWGWGKELIGLEAPVPIISFIPMFMFAILFGLSMDYEVFLLSRVREEYQRTGDNDSSVIAGIATTARVITSAALIMISVFGGFVLGDDPAIKMFGLGLATAILVDATIVRLVLVPATMKLLGDANWWLPGWLDRILPTVDIEGGAELDALTGAGRPPSLLDADIAAGSDVDAEVGAGRVPSSV